MDLDRKEVIYLSREKSLKNKVILITGASSGLGEQIAYESSLKGAIVILAARRIEKLREVQKTCEKLSGKKAYVFHLDISNPEEIEEVLEKTSAEVGPIDVLINNAGFGHFEDFRTVDMNIAEKMMRVNVLGLMYTSQFAAIQMAERGKGHIINICSMSGKIATPKSTIYSASKFAVLGFSNALRLDLKPLNVGVTTVNLGPVKTDFFDLADKNGDYLEKVGQLALDPKNVAHQVVSIMGTSKRELNLPKIMEFASRAYILFPKIGDFLAGTAFNKK